MNRTRILYASLALIASLALLWGLWPAWTLWLDRHDRWAELVQQQQRMQTALQEAQTLQKKSLPSLAESQSLIQTISRQRFGVPPINLPGGSVQIPINAVSPQQLAQGWDDIRTQTSARVVRAELDQTPQGWSGTLIFKLPQKP
ncbi:MAG: hypothetical protein RLZZ123_2562 [Pseudomonadota bacterium]|jgi:hypothetical protein